MLELLLKIVHSTPCEPLKRFPLRNRMLLMRNAITRALLLLVKHPSFLLLKLLKISMLVLPLTASF